MSDSKDSKGQLMPFPVPPDPKIYHIMHLNNLVSVINDGVIWSDSVVAQKANVTTIGMSTIKQRRLLENRLVSHPDLFVGDCVPFYFCPRSIMLNLIYMANHVELTYRGGQQPIIHLEVDLHRTVAWAEQYNRKWAFTLSNAGAFYFEDRADFANLNEINWNSVATDRWSGNGVDPSIKEGKQAEFLIEEQLPWELVERIGVYSNTQMVKVNTILHSVSYKPTVQVKRNWYY